MSNWYELSAAETTAELKTDVKAGLSDSEAGRRLDEYGPNELIERGLKSPWKIFWEQLTSTLVVVLIVAAVVSAFLGDFKDATAIMLIVVLNAVLGFRQEYSAEKAMAALKKLAVPVVKVRRNGSVQEISARELVPGDIIMLEAGDLAPADARLLSSANLRVEEAALTGESAPVEKSPDATVTEGAGVGDRRNMVHMGTIVVYGHGEAVVTDTGMNTQLGRIADMIQTVEHEPTPLQKRLDRLGKVLAAVALAIVVVIFVLGWLRGEDLRLMFLTAVSLAVAAVPEGLPAVVTIALSIGAQRMLRRNALIRKLPAVEALGSVTVICSDKTGTLTENQMTVTVLDVAGNRFDLPHGGALRGEDSPGGEAAMALEHNAVPLLLAGGALCNDAVLETESGDSDSYRVIGDPTEGALAVAAARAGLLKAQMEEALPRVDEEPFDSVRKRMTTVHELPDDPSLLPERLQWLASSLGGNGSAPYIAFTKGASDSLLGIASHVWVDNVVEPMTPEYRERIAAANDDLASNGMRVLGVGFRSLDDLAAAKEGGSLEDKLTFVGLVAMIDPPRPEVKGAVATCISAGIRPMMITGDHPLTAQHIAEELGITSEKGLLTGRELDGLSPEELDEVVNGVSIYARVSPEHKLDIVQALQRKGNVVAMTGDGVNDAPALKRADIGVAMGITGTDVSKEASEMVLQDDNFATIVAAIEEGRTIYDNIRKFIRYLLTCNSGEIWVMLLAPFAGMPLPLLPLQILWMNLVTDGLPALALGVEPPEPNIMQRKPVPPTEGIFARGMGRDIIVMGLLMGLAPLALGYFAYRAGDPGWQTMTFTALVLSQMTFALAVRSERESLSAIGILSNRAMVGAVLLTFVLQLIVVYFPPAQAFFDTQALSARDLLLSLVLATIPFIGFEVQKWWRRRSA